MRRQEYCWRQAAEDVTPSVCPICRPIFQSINLCLWFLMSLLTRWWDLVVGADEMTLRYFINWLFNRPYLPHILQQVQYSGVVITCLITVLCTVINPLKRVIRISILWACKIPQHKHGFVLIVLLRHLKINQIEGGTVVGRDKFGCLSGVEEDPNTSSILDKTFDNPQFHSSCSVGISSTPPTHFSPTQTISELNPPLGIFEPSHVFISKVLSCRGLGSQWPEAFQSIRPHSPRQRWGDLQLIQITVLCFEEFQIFGPKFY